MHPPATVDQPIADEELFHLLALSLLEGIGPKTARSLLRHFGSAKSVFQASVKLRSQINGVGEQRARLFTLDSVGPRAEQEMRYMEAHHIQPIPWGSSAYPSRLQQCDDAPIILFYRGNATLNAPRHCAIIGTRKNTDYGLRCCEDLVEQLSGTPGLCIMSGLALGIDTIAHKAAVKHQVPTIGVLGHGLDILYPASNRSLAQDMQLQGGLLTEFPSQTKLNAQNFPVRNRIVAALADVVVVVESEVKGGAMITASLAASYNREIAAFPGRIYDARSSGPNQLIMRQMAAMISCGDDLLSLMNWGTRDRPNAAQQQQLFLTLSPEEQSVVSVLSGRDAVHSDELLARTELGHAQLAAVLLALELQMLVKVLPGKVYRLA